MPTLTPTPEIQLFAPGSVVTLKTGHEAKIISVTVHAGRRICYSVVWYYLRQRCKATVEAFEIQCGPSPYVILPREIAQAATAAKAAIADAESAAQAFEIDELEIHKIARPKVHRPAAA